MKKILILSALIVSCSHSPEVVEKKLDTESLEYQRVISAYEKSNMDLDAGNFKKAIAQYKKILKNPDLPSNLYPLVEFNTATAYEEMNFCRSASRHYKAVIKNGRYKQLTASSQLRLAYAFDCLGKNQKAIDILLEIETEDLPKAAATTEVHARLGAAYIKAGKIEEARELFRKAERGLSEIRDKNASPNLQITLMARSMYLMGKINPLSFTYKNRNNYLKATQQLQKYLLQSAALGEGAWSPKASANLLATYTHSLKKLEDWPTHKNSSKNVLLKNQQVDFARNILSNIESLRQSQFPEERRSRLMIHLLTRIENIEHRLRAYVSQYSKKILKKRRPRSATRRRTKKGAL